MRVCWGAMEGVMFVRLFVTWKAASAWRGLRCQGGPASCSHRWGIMGTEDYSVLGGPPYPALHLACARPGQMGPASILCSERDTPSEISPKGLLLSLGFWNEPWRSFPTVTYETLMEKQPVWQMPYGRKGSTSTVPPTHPYR